ncbi:hypothetical protein ACLOJK_014176 [Asimina triloba]
MQADDAKEALEHKSSPTKAQSRQRGKKTEYGRPPQRANRTEGRDELRSNPTVRGCWTDGVAFQDDEKRQLKCDRHGVQFSIMQWKFHFHPMILTSVMRRGGACALRMACEHPNRAILWAFKTHVEYLRTDSPIDSISGSRIFFSPLIFFFLVL